MPFALKHASHATAMSRNSAKNGRRFESKDQIYRVTCSRAHWLKQNLTLILNRLQPCSSFSHLDVEKETINCSQSSNYHQFSFVDSKNELTKNWSNTSFFSALFWSIPKLIRCVSKPSVVWHVSRSRHAEFTKTCKQHVHLGRLVWSESPGRFTRSFLHTNGKMQYEMHSYIHINICILVYIYSSMHI